MWQWHRGELRAGGGTGGIIMMVPETQSPTCHSFKPTTSNRKRATQRLPPYYSTWQSDHSYDRGRYMDDDDIVYTWKVLYHPLGHPLCLCWKLTKGLNTQKIFLQFFNPVPIFQNKLQIEQWLLSWAIKATKTQPNRWPPADPLISVYSPIASRNLTG